MNARFRIALVMAGVIIASQAAAQVTFYEHQGFEGHSFTTEKPIKNLSRQGFSNHASSIVVRDNRWEVCTDVRYNGQCAILRPGRYPSLAAMGLNNSVSSVRSVDNNARIDDRRYAPVPVAAQVTFYEHQGFEGRSFTTEEPVSNFGRHGFNDRASSVVVLGDRWEVCEDNRFSGRCAVLRPGRYPSLAAMGLNNQISSVRAVNINARVDDHRYAPAPIAGYNFYRRNNERLYEASVTSVRAVLVTLEQRCWVEREDVAQERRSVNVPGAMAGTIIGGILGHQVGGGRGQDIVTAGGATAVTRIGGSAQAVQTRDVERCNDVPSQANPDYWDVTYHFRGQAHRMQMTAPPGPTVTVNELGEPRA
jgi:uncharacterized protein YcfJ